MGYLTGSYKDLEMSVLVVHWKEYPKGGTLHGQFDGSFNVI